MLRKGLVVFAAAAVMVAVACATPADAAKKKGKKRASAPSSTSLDGRTLGYPRTCGFTYYQTDAWGVPVGPYCH
jgi:hypothetical protein